MTYRITAIRDGECAYREVRRRSDAAELALRRLVHGIIGDFGGLDTEQGHATMRRAEDIDVTRGGTFTAYEYTIIVTASRLPPGGLGL